MIGAICTLVVGIAVSAWQRSSHAKESSALKHENSTLKQDLGKAAARIQELEFQLTPYRMLALERFGKADAETLRKLA